MELSEKLGEKAILFRDDYRSYCYCPDLTSWAMMLSVTYLNIQMAYFSVILHHNPASVLVDMLRGRLGELERMFHEENFWCRTLQEKHLRGLFGHPGGEEGDRD